MSDVFLLSGKRKANRPIPSFGLLLADTVVQKIWTSGVAWRLRRLWLVLLCSSKESTTGPWWCTPLFFILFVWYPD